MGLIFATAKIPGMSKGEQGVKNQFTVITLFSSPEALKQPCTVSNTLFNQRSPVHCTVQNLLNREWLRFAGKAFIYNMDSFGPKSRDNPLKCFLQL